MSGINTRIFVIRHGQSLANEQKLIVSLPSTGGSGYGLTATGRRQASEAAASLAVLGQTRPYTYIHMVASEFLRAQETAQVVYNAFECSRRLMKHSGLNERSFGSLDGQADDRYADVWTLDAQGDTASNKYLGVERCQDVLHRVLCAIRDLLAQMQDMHGREESSGSDERILVLVGHGDPFNILTAVVNGGLDAWRHRELPPMRNAEVRELDAASLQLHLDQIERQD
eukprot:jgi/Hompol1/2754/HPOL_001448-RA